jgi:hypothetical protein
MSLHSVKDGYGPLPPAVELPSGLWPPGVTHHELSSSPPLPPAFVALTTRVRAHRYSFLVYTSVILFYFPRGRVSQQLESNSRLPCR